MKMRNSLRLKRGHYDTQIKELLRGKQMTRAELVKKCEAQGIPNSTAYKRINIFRKQGDFQLVEYIKLSEKYDEADSELIRDYLDKIETSIANNILESRLHALGLTSLSSRVVHHPRVLLVFEKLLDQQENNYDELVFNEIMYTLYNIIRFEYELNSPDSHVYLKSLKGKILDKLMIVLSGTDQLPNRNAMLYLRESGGKREISFIFQTIKSHHDEMNLENLGYVFSRKGRLYMNHQKYIDELIDELLVNEKKELISFGKDLRNYIYKSRI